MLGTEAYLDGFDVKSEAIHLVIHKLLNILSLVTLELDDFTHFVVSYNTAIASYPKLVTPSEEK